MPFLLLVLATASCILVVSTYYEIAAYESFFPGLLVFGVPLALLLAVPFNVAKGLLAWIVNRENGLLNRTAGHAVRFGLYAISMLCAGLIVIAGTHDPNLAQVVAEERERIEQSYGRRVFDLRTQTRTAAMDVRDRYREQRARIEEQLRGEVAHYEGMREAESRNVVNGVWKGPRYLENKRLLDEARARFDAALERLRQEEGETLTRLREVEAERVGALLEEQRTALASVTADNFRGTASVQDQKVLAALHLVNTMTGTHFEPMHLALVVSILIATLVEFTPIVLLGFVARHTPGPSAPAKTSAPAAPAGDDVRPAGPPPAPIAITRTATARSAS